ncbi:MAG: SDR family NAD(P)-dependent oxidoreductase, partial [Rhizobacter sp.]
MNITPDLEGRIAVVTGAAGTMGRAAAQALQGDGCKLVLVDIDTRSLDELAGALGGAGRALAVACDISDRDAVA